jgi:Tol biopolymer transport system component
MASLARSLFLVASVCAAQNPIAFSEKDHLWIADLANPSNRRIIWSGEAVSPEFSIGQTWLAFVDHQRLIVASAAGTKSFTPFGSETSDDFVWSPKGETLAVVKENDVYTISEHEQWTPVRVFEGSDKASPSTPLFSPDGKKLAIGLRVAGPEGVDAGSARVIDLGDGKVTEFRMSDGIILDKWTPDGKNILFWKDPSFSASSAADGLPLFAASFPDGAVRSLGVETLVYPSLNQFSPDGKFLVVTEGIGRATWTNKRISVVDISTGKKTPLTSGKVAALFPSWSPTGESIAYAAGPDVSDEVREGPNLTLGQVRIWVMNADGSQQRQLTSDPAYRDEQPRWSADGKSILFCRVIDLRKAACGASARPEANPSRLPDRFLSKTECSDFTATPTGAAAST